MKKEKRSERSASLPPPSPLALEEPLCLGPCLPAFSAPAAGSYWGSGRRVGRLIGLSVPTLSPGHLPSPHIAMLGWETLAVRNPLAS